MHLTWYAARAGGLVAWALAAGSVVWGLLMSTRVLTGRTDRPWTRDLHRFLGGAALVFTGIHVGALLLDTYTPFSLTDVLVPFATSWHPTAVAWGIVAFYLLLAVELTSLLRRRLPAGWWRRVHFASFALAATATVHALTAGTDARVTLVWTGVWVLVAAMSLLVVLRLADAIGRRPAPPARTARPAPATVPARPDGP